MAWAARASSTHVVGERPKAPRSQRGVFSSTPLPILRAVCAFSLRWSLSRFGKPHAPPSLNLGPWSCSRARHRYATFPALQTRGGRSGLTRSSAPGNTNLFTCVCRVGQRETWPSSALSFGLGLHTTPLFRGRQGRATDMTPYGRCAKSWTVPDRRIDVWANQTHKSASLTGLDSPLFGGTTILTPH